MSKYKFIVNGLEVEANYSEKDIDNIYKPLINNLYDLQIKLNRRIIIFIAACPGTGKSTFVSFLQYLDNNQNIQSIGIDGFHYKQEYLNNHYNSDNILLSSIKGSPDTFDVLKLNDYLNRLKQEDIYWPTYSRKLHDPIENDIYINKKIILLEGNYLLYNQEPWNKLLQYADYTIFLKQDYEILKQRLIERKIAGGSSLDQAINHFEKVDGINIKLVLDNYLKPDLELLFDSNNNIIL